MFDHDSDFSPKNYDDGGPAAKPAMIITAAGLVLFVVMLATVFRWNFSSSGKNAGNEPKPVPDIQITSTIGSLDEIAVIQYYNHDDYPDGPPVKTGDELEYDGKTYVLFRIDPGLVSTAAGDCWEAVYRLPKRDTRK